MRRQETVRAPQRQQQLSEKSNNRAIERPTSNDDHDALRLTERTTRTRPDWPQSRLSAADLCLLLPLPLCDACERRRAKRAEEQKSPKCARFCCYFC